MNVLNGLDDRSRIDRCRINRHSISQRIASVALLSMLAACASRPIGAPVVDSDFGSGQAATAATAQVTDNSPVPPGFYRAKPGENLYRIALNNGQRFSDVARWNNISNPNKIKAGQLVRVVPPPGEAVTSPVPEHVAPASSLATQSPAPVGHPLASVGPQPVVPSSSNDSTPAAGSISLIWPAHGKVIGAFNDTTNKGINIAGNQGDPIFAAYSGKVVYSGNGLRGYGNLIIIKHDATFLTAYAHNSKLLVKEGDNVTKGQKIAEMGKSDADQVELHFELRRQGKPVDPMKYLPPQ